MTGALTNRRSIFVAAGWRQRVRDSATVAGLHKKSTGNRKTCGKKATADVPQRETSI
jgi:hypothetical protein